MATSPALWASQRMGINHIFGPRIPKTYFPAMLMKNNTQQVMDAFKFKVIGLASKLHVEMGKIIT